MPAAQPPEDGRATPRVPYTPVSLRTADWTSMMFRTRRRHQRLNESASCACGTQPPEDGRATLRITLRKLCEYSDQRIHSAIDNRLHGG